MKKHISNKLVLILAMLLCHLSSVNGQTKFNRNIPDDAHTAITNNISMGISTFSFTPSGGWILVSKTGKMMQKNIPLECEKKVKEFLAKGHKIKNVAFPPKGGNSWIIVTDKTTFSRNIPNECYKKIQEFQKRGKKISLVAFPTRIKTENSWVILNNDGSFFARNIDDECYQILGNLRESDMPGKKAARKITHISFAPNGGFVVLAEDYRFARNIDDECFLKMRTMSKGRNLIHTVVFNPKRRGWSIISNRKITSRPKDRIRSFESNVGGKQLWERMRELNVPGLSVGVVINGKLAWTTAYGHLKKGSREHAVHPESMFQAASISKVLAAIGAFKLAEQKKINLYENLLTSKRLKWQIPFHDAVKDSAWTKKFKHLTILNILNHRSGIEGRGALLDANGANQGRRSGGGYDGYTSSSNLPTLKTLMQNISITYNPDTGPPSTDPWYSGMAFTVLQKLTQDVTNTNYNSWMKTNILNPLGMKKSEFTTHPENLYQRKNLTFGYYTDTRKTVRKRYPEYAAAGLYTNAKELANVVIMLNQGGKINGRNVLTFNSAGSIRYGNGTYALNSGKRYSHGGTNAGYRSFLIGFPKVNSSSENIKTAGIVVLTNGNTENGRATPLRDEIISAVRNAYGW